MDMAIKMITLKFTQSNSVCFGKKWTGIGVVQVSSQELTV